MSEVMSLFQSMFEFKSAAPASITASEVRLAMCVKREAVELETVADEEMQNGRMTQKLALEQTDKAKIRIFTEIAIWHSRRAAEKYRKAAEKFEETGKIYIKKSKAFSAKAKKMVQCAAEAKTVVDSLQALLKQNQENRKGMFI